MRAISPEQRGKIVPALVQAYVIEHPSGQWYVVAGFCLGLVAFYGRNHSLYGAVTSMGGLFWIALDRHASPGIISGQSLE